MALTKKPVYFLRMIAPGVVNCAFFTVPPVIQYLIYHRVVPISYKKHAGATFNLRNYTVGHEQTVNLTIAEALLTTLSTPPYFSSVSIVKDAGTFEYTSPEWMLSNSTQEIISEAHGIFGRDERVACILNLGSGRPGVFSSPEGTQLSEWNRFLEDLATNGERTAESLESQFGNLGLYHRFSVTSGLERSTVLGPGEILTHTSAYLAEVSISRRVDTCMEALKVRDGVISLEQLSMFSTHSWDRDILTHT